MIKVLYIGDVSTRAGREVVRDYLPKVKSENSPDLVVANVENAAGGIGITEKMINELVGYGIDLCTGGDHTFSIKDFYQELNGNLPFIRPANYEDQNLPGEIYESIDLGEKGRVGVVQLLGRELFSYTQKVENPFLFFDRFYELSSFSECDIRIVEIHAESTAEKMSLAWYVKDRVESVVGTHTHVATADARVFGVSREKINYVTDIGQVGPANASLWAEFSGVIHNFKSPLRVPQKPELTGPRMFNSVLLEFNDKCEPIGITRIDKFDI